MPKKTINGVTAVWGRDARMTQAKEAEFCRKRTVRVMSRPHRPAVAEKDRAEEPPQRGE